ncbi:receptor-like cytosolic serine/threonine-protein kinase RBK2 [Lathyrus oleraceus]|uniref:receptor-like cytosolic serine/threonine-protein kinase RBK2 n=1 Tax=Pisum sativum TaxID=3888 RepID=UPI0021CE66D1|nr:receptor-like cytosolic serine/threonine-protein kinase RBK2 [Pisum sativum]
MAKKGLGHELWRKTLDNALNPNPPTLGTLLGSSASALDLRNMDLEKDKEDEASPRGVLEACVRGFDDPASPESETSCSDSRARSHWGKFFKLWKKKPIKRLSSIPPIAINVPKIPKWKSKSTRETQVKSNICKFRSSWVTFSLSDLRSATDNFSHKNLIGRGGFSEVYKGSLQNGRLIAVKKLTTGSTDEKTAGFLSELGIIAHVDHPNTAKLVGCCVDGEMHIVFELSTLGSLGSVLHGSNKPKLDWSKRYKVALGIADGLLYLHENCERRIIHRDIKAENILLTENFEPQICDFGLAKWLPEQLTHHNVSTFEGTFGYFAPEYFMHGIVDEKTDVYSFGVLLLVIITGRKPVVEMQSIVTWAKPLLDANNVKDVVDPSLGDDYDQGQIECVGLTASMCVEQSPILRPRMNQVVTLLRGNDSALNAKANTVQRTYSQELLDVQEYNSTKYLSDLNRHKQIALSFDTSY